MTARRWLAFAVFGLAIGGCNDPAGPPLFLRNDLLAYRSLVEGGLFVMRPDGSSRHRIWFGNDFAMCDSWAPDGSAIAFHSGNQIIKVTVATAHEDTLTSGPYYNHCPMWSPDSRRIAFIRFADTMTAGYQLYVMSADGTNPTRLGTATFVADRGSWSPDGKWIAATRFADDQIVLINATTGEAGTPLKFGRAPSWSPDGQRIAFSAQTSSGSAIYVMDSSGQNVQPLTSGDLVDQYPVWTPDGTLITFHRYEYMPQPSLPPRLVSSLHMLHLDGGAVPWPVGESAGGDLVIWRPQR